MRVHRYGVLLMGALIGSGTMAADRVDLSPVRWPAADRQHYEGILDHTPTVTGVVRGASTGSIGRGTNDCSSFRRYTIWRNSWSALSS